eukprot:SM000089S23821  [mRNA]  locus=s89:271020:273343:+ [translate_table: standard]
MEEDSPFRATVLAGRAALITGGGSGIGLEIARQFGRHGARLALMGRREPVLKDAAELLRADGTEAIWVQGDVRSKDDAARAVERAVAAFGRLDILVNGAAGNFLAPAEDLSANGFRTVLDIDTVGTFTMSLAARPHLSRGAPGRESEPDGGLIINISATLQYTAAWYQVHLVAAKAAIDSLTRSLALEWGTDHGIRANIIAPGPIGNTPGMDKLAPSEVGIEPSDYIPLGRMGESWDIAMAALYLASPAGKWVSGATMVVDGAGWLYRPRLVSKEVLRTLGRTVEQRSRERPRTLSERGPNKPHISSKL